MDEQRKPERALVPALRFEGFNDPWEQRKLGEVVRNLSTGKSVNSLDEQGSEGEICVLKTSCVSANSFDPTERKQVVESERDLARCPVEKGTLVVSRMNTPDLVGSCGYCAADMGNLFLPDRLWKVSFEDSASPYFIYTALASFACQERLKAAATGTSGSMKNVSQSSLLDLDLSVPLLEEQQRVGVFFAKLDSLIALHQCKHDKLKTVKQSLLEKMFPKEGKDVPEIRFEGFTEPWEQRRLGECGTTYGGLSGKTKEDFGHGEARFVSYTNVFENPIADTSRLEPVEIDPKQNQVRLGDVFFTVSSETPEDVGMSSVWLSDQPNVYLNSFCFGYRQDESFDSDYLAYMLRSQGVRYDIALLAQGISRFNISKNKVMELDVPFPEKGEQELIGTFFRKLDSLIALHQRELEILKNLKKAMLEKMFV